MPRIVWRPAVATLFIHGLLIYLLTANWSSTERERIRVKPAPNVIHASLVDAAELQAKPKPPPPKQVPPLASSHRSTASSIKRPSTTSTARHKLASKSISSCAVSAI